MIFPVLILIFIVVVNAFLLYAVGKRNNDGIIF